MTEYVVCFARREWEYHPYEMQDQILVVEKQKPAWQKGRLNLVGGKVEPGEDPLTAALRELKEESGYEAQGKGEVVGRILGVDCIVYCCAAFVDHELPIEQAAGEIEKVFWMSWSELRADARIMPNLKVIIPLMLTGVKDWTITDQCCSGRYGDRLVHDISIQLDIPMPFTNAAKNISDAELARD